MADNSDIPDLTTQERLTEARNKLHELIVRKNAIISQGGDGLSLTRGIGELRNYIKDLEQQMANESTAGLQWMLRNSLD